MFNFKKTLLINSIIASVLPIITIVSCNSGIEIANSDTQAVKNAKAALEKLTNDQKTVDLTKDANQKLPSEIEPTIKSIKALNALIKGVIVVPNGITYALQVIDINDDKGEFVVEIKTKKGAVIETISFTIAGFTTTSQVQAETDAAKDNLDNSDDTFTKTELVERWKKYIEDSIESQKNLAKTWINGRIPNTYYFNKQIMKSYLDKIFENIQSCLIKIKKLFSKSNFFEKSDKSKLLDIWGRIIILFNGVTKNLEELFLKLEKSKDDVDGMKNIAFTYAKTISGPIISEFSKMENILSKYEIELPYKNELPN